MRTTLYICILVSLLFAPVERLDVAQLQPVQTVAVSISGSGIVIETDTNNRGQGGTVEEAVADLKSNTPGVIYLDTAQYLLLTQEAEVYSPALEAYMRPTVGVSLWDGKGSVEEAAKFLEVRRDLPRLRDYKKEK